MPLRDKRVVVRVAAVGQQLDAGVIVPRVVVVSRETRSKGIVDLTRQRIGPEERAQRDEILVRKRASQNLVAAGAAGILEFRQRSPGCALGNGEVVSHPMGDPPVGVVSQTT